MHKDCDQRAQQKFCFVFSFQFFLTNVMHISATDFRYSAQILLENALFCRQNARSKNRLFCSKFCRQNLSKPNSVAKSVIDCVAPALIVVVPLRSMAGEQVRKNGFDLYIVGRSSRDHEISFYRVARSIGTRR